MPSPIAPYEETVNRNNFRVHSFVPRASLFGSAKQWYDKIVESYHVVGNGDPKLVERVALKHNYAIFGLGNRTIDREVESLGQPEL